MRSGATSAPRWTAYADAWLAPGSPLEVGCRDAQSLSRARLAEETRSTAARSLRQGSVRARRRRATRKPPRPDSADRRRRRRRGADGRGARRDRRGLATARQHSAGVLGPIGRRRRSDGRPARIRTVRRRPRREHRSSRRDSARRARSLPTSRDCSGPPRRMSSRPRAGASCPPVPTGSRRASDERAALYRGVPMVDSRTPPEVDRVAASRRAVAARRARAALKQDVAMRVITPQTLLDAPSRTPESPRAPCASPSSCTSIPAIGEGKRDRILDRPRHLAGQAPRRTRRTPARRSATLPRPRWPEPAPRARTQPSPRARGTDGCRQGDGGRADQSRTTREIHALRLGHDAGPPTRRDRWRALLLRRRRRVRPHDRGRRAARARDGAQPLPLRHPPRADRQRARRRDAPCFSRSICRAPDRCARPNRPRRSSSCCRPAGTSSCTDSSGAAPKDAEERARRLRTAKVELAAQNEFDYRIVNDDVAAAAARGRRLTSERPRVLDVTAGLGQMAAATVVATIPSTDSGGSAMAGHATKGSSIPPSTPCSARSTRSTSS